MSTATRARADAPIPYQSGFCGLRLPAESHRRCPLNAARCACPCHHTCPTCGQQVPTAPGAAT